MTDDFFRSRIDQMIDFSHPLAVLASRLPWAAMLAGVAPYLAHKELPAWFKNPCFRVTPTYKCLPPKVRDFSINQGLSGPI